MPTPKGSDGLTDKQRSFVEEYLVDLNATQAAIRAGYSEKTAAEIGCENLGKPQIAAAIGAAFEERSAKTGATAERVVKELCRLAYSDVRRYYAADGKLRPLAELDDDAAAALSGVEPHIRKVRLHDKHAALVTLAKHLGMLKERIEMTGKDGGPLELRDVSTGELAKRARELAARLEKRPSAAPRSR